MTKTHAIHDLEIIGYAERLTEDLLPRMVVPVFRFRHEPNEVLMPPYRPETSHIHGGVRGTVLELATAEAQGRFTALESPISAQPGHRLWIDRSFQPRYEPETEARRHLSEIAKQSAAASKEALRENRYEEALDLAQEAISADESCIDAVLTKAIVHRLLGNEGRVALLADVAAAIDPHIDFNSWIDLYQARQQLRAGASQDPVHRADHASLNSHLFRIVDELVRQGVTLTQARQEFEKQFVTASLRKHEGSLARSARSLGLPRKTLKNKVLALGIEPGNR